MKQSCHDSSLLSIFLYGLVRAQNFFFCFCLMAYPRDSQLRPVQTLATLLTNKTQHCWAQLSLLRAFAYHVVCCCDLLEVVGSCWMKFETSQTSEPTNANIFIVSRSSKRGPTMLRSFAQHIQQCCAGARALRATYPHKYMRKRNKNGIGDGKRPRVLYFLI